jgi:DNA-binding LytR/AlgR family response regulator
MRPQFYFHKQGHTANFPEPAKSASMLKMHVQNIGKTAFPLTDLMFLQATGNYCWLYWKDGQRILSSRTLKFYVPQLPDGLFVRPHRNCIVNLQYIKRMEYISANKGGLLYLYSDVVLPVSRRRWLAMMEICQRLQA